jgi:enoyl-CoA hydratase/carnithine racemase
MKHEQIVYKTADHVALITLNRPSRLNAWTAQMAAEVRDAMHHAGRDEKIRIIVLTGEGKGFCAGADMEDLGNASGKRVDETMSPEQKVSAMMGTKTVEESERDNPDNIRPDFRKRYSYLPAIPKPIIAAINGPAVGLGLIVALFCDLRFASEKASFSTAFSRRGLIAEHGISWILPRITGLSNALDLLFSARIIDAREAFRIGLVNRVLPEPGFMEGVLDYASELTELVSPRSLSVIKRQVYSAQFQTLAEASEAADSELILSLKSADFKEGVAHFMEKRPPVFTGR